MPLAYGSVTPSAAAVATAASTALPPARSTSMPTWLATGSTEATAPPDPVIVATLGRRWPTGLGPCRPWASLTSWSPLPASAEGAFAGVSVLEGVGAAVAAAPTRPKGSARASVSAPIRAARGEGTCVAAVMAGP